MKFKQVICSIISASVLISTAAATNWGLWYGNGINQPPNGEDTVETLNQYSTYFIGDASKNTIYLTFDCGYENGYTSKILDILKKHNVPSAFFLLGDYIDRNPELVKRMVNEGHIIGNHTTNHPNITKISNTRLLQELTTLDSKFQTLTGRYLDPFFRPPEGSYTYNSLKTIQNLGYNTILWSVAYADWDVDNQPSYQSAINTLNNRIHGGAIILLHTVSKTNAEILDDLITGWKNQGYEFDYLSSLPQFNSGVVEAIPSNCKFYLDSNPVNITSYLFDDSNFIKLRDLAAALDGTTAKFEIEFADDKISITKNHNYSKTGLELLGKPDVAAMQSKKSEQVFSIDGQNKILDAYNILNNNYISLRELCDIFSIDIIYDAQTNSVNMQIK